MSVPPVLAALAGLVILGQLQDLHEWLGIAIIVAAYISATSAPADARRASEDGAGGEPMLIIVRRPAWLASR